MRIAGTSGAGAARALTVTALFSLGLLAGCKGAVFGSGTLFVWNSTDKAVQLQLEGRTSDDTPLSPETGKRYDDAVAGSYKLTWRGAEGPKEVTFELKPDETVIVNLGGKSCFARTDITGMYQSGKERVRFLEAYEPQDLISMHEILGVFPGETAPQTRSRTDILFQRLSAVPCNLVKDTHEITEFVRKQR